jgi:hypothetical protein
MDTAMLLEYQRTLSMRFSEKNSEERKTWNTLFRDENMNYSVSSLPGPVPCKLVFVLVLSEQRGYSFVTKHRRSRLEVAFIYDLI